MDHTPREDSPAPVAGSLVHPGGRALSPFITNSPPYHKLRGKFSGFGVQPLSPFPCPVSKTLAAVLGS